MKKEMRPPTVVPETTPSATRAELDSPFTGVTRRRSFLKGLGVAGASLTAGALLPMPVKAQENTGNLTRGDAAILRFLAAAEIIESDLWLQYAELGRRNLWDTEPLSAGVSATRPRWLAVHQQQYDR